MAAFESVLDGMRADGVLLTSERLHPTDTATTVRCWDGGDVVKGAHTGEGARARASGRGGR